MKIFFCFLTCALLLTLSSACNAQSSATPSVMGYLSTTGCPPNVTTCFIQYSSANPLPVSGGGSGGATPSIAATITDATSIIPIVSTAAENNHILKASAGVLYGAYAANVTATAGWLIIVNQTTVPTTGALTGVVDFCYLPANGQCGINSKPGPPTAYSTGLVALISSAASPLTYTTGTVTAVIHGEVQ